MSKRAGAFVTLDDLLDAIGVDATRFFMLRSSHDRTLELDLELAAKQSAENPVYYVQYAHARIASMLAKATPAGWRRAVKPVRIGARLPLETSERELIKRIAAFPEEVAEAAERRGPHRIVSYCLDLARDFTSFYERCRVVGAEPEGVESFRLALSSAAQRTIAASWACWESARPDRCSPAGLSRGVAERLSSSSKRWVSPGLRASAGYLWRCGGGPGPGSARASGAA